MIPAVAVSGRAGSGKSTFAGLLVSLMDERGVSAVRVAFGDALKKEVLDLYGITKHEPGGREALIRHGELMRRRDPDYWIRPVDERVRLARVCGVVPVVDDMRFSREWDWACRVGAVKVRMEASLAWRYLRLKEQGMDGTFAWSAEPGEMELEGVLHSVTVQNGGAVDLRAAASEALATLLRGPVAA